MPTYKFTALNEVGHKISGEKEAKNETELDHLLRALDLELLSFEEEAYKKSSAFGKVRREDLATMCTQMYHLTRAGIPLIEAIEGVQQAQGPGAVRNVLVGVNEWLLKGEELSDAFAHYPAVFSPFFIGMVAVGEKTGKVPFAFKELEEYLRWIIQLRRLVIKAVRYPLISMFFTSGFVFLLLAYALCYAMHHTFVLPEDWLKFIPVSYIVLHYWGEILTVPPLLGYGTFWLYRKSEAFAYMADGVLLKIPHLKDIITRLNMARFSRVFALLFNAGIDVIESLHVATGVIRNRTMRESVLGLEDYVKRGLTLTESVRMSGQFPETVIQAFYTGEKTGNMTDAFANVNYFYKRQVDDAVDVLIGFLRPALMVIAGFLLI